MSPENEKPVLIVSAIFIIFTAFAAAGCRTGNDDEKNDLCPEGYRAEGPACVPIFDDPEDCPGPNEMPKLGGGCRPVGVLECAEGFVKDSDGGCEPILPDHECPPGAMEVIGETECCPVGVIECGEGFVSDGQGGCDAILPPGPDPCPPGTIEQIGHDTCQPLGDCGPDPSEGGSPWGNIQVDDKTIFVDRTSDADEPDGTQSAPYRTVTEALQAVEPGGQVAIAAGEYEERLILNKPVRLTGRCSELVTLRGIVRFGVPEPALRIGSGGSGSEVRGVTLTGPGIGLNVDGAEQVLVEDMEVRDAEYVGIAVLDESELMLRRVKVINCSTIGIYSQNSIVSLEHGVVQGTLPETGTDWFGRGIDVTCSNASSCGEFNIESSLITNNREAGIVAEGVDLTVRSTVVRDNLPTMWNDYLGVGILAQCNENEICGTVTVEKSLFSGNHEAGILVGSVDLKILSSVVRSTLPRKIDLLSGAGIVSTCDVEMGKCGILEVEGSFISSNRTAGILAGGVDTKITASVVMDTLPQESDQILGVGIISQCLRELNICGFLEVERSLVKRNHLAGIAFRGSNGAISFSVVRDTLPGAEHLMGGVGIEVQCDESIKLCGAFTGERNIIYGNHTAGVVVYGADATIVSSVVRDTLPQESDAEFGIGLIAQCCEKTGVCGTLTIEDNLLERNHKIGILASGVDATVISSVIRDTIAQESDENFGRGINAQCDWRVGTCGSLWILNSLVARNENVGIVTIGTPATLQGVAVIDTVTNVSGTWQGEYGQGIFAMCFKDSNIHNCGTLSIDSSMVVSSHSAGVAVEGVSGIMTQSMVHTVSPQPKDGKYGYGVQIAGREEDHIGAFPSFHVRESVIRGARLAGVFYHSSEGVLSGTVISGGEYSVAKNQGSLPSIEVDNLLSGSVENEPQWVNLSPAPAPMPAEPMEPW